MVALRSSRRLASLIPSAGKHLATRRRQYNGFTGGNPNLVPEVATTKTVGVVLQPRFIPRFAFTVDYWNIDLKKAIQGFGPDTIIADCIANSTASAIAPSCALIHRDPGGSIWLTSEGYIRDLPNNIGRIKTDGFDFNGSYSHRLGGFGQLSLSFLGYLAEALQGEQRSRPDL